MRREISADDVITPISTNPNATSKAQRSQLISTPAAVMERFFRSDAKIVFSRHQALLIASPSTFMPILDIATSQSACARTPSIIGGSHPRGGASVFPPCDKRI